LQFSVALTSEGFKFNFNLNIWILTIEVDILLSLTPHWKGRITMGFENLYDEVAKLCTNVSGTALESVAMVAQKGLKVLS